MSKKKELVISCEEGMGLLRLASVFGLPEKLGEIAYTPAERGLAADEVRKLYRELRSHSPMMLKPQRWTLFGPADNFKAITNEAGESGHRLMDPLRKVKLVLDEEADSGLVWLLIYGLHPASPNCQGVGIQEDLFWPVVAKAKRLRAVKEALGFDKATPRRWASDDDEEESESEGEAEGDGDAPAKEPVKESA